MILNNVKKLAVAAHRNFDFAIIRRRVVQRSVNRGITLGKVISCRLSN